MRLTRWLAVALRFSARRLLALSNRLSPPVPLPASHPAARAVLRRAAGVDDLENAWSDIDQRWPQGAWESESYRAVVAMRRRRLVGRDGSEWMVGGPMPEGVQLAPMTDPYREEKP